LLRNSYSLVVIVNQKLYFSCLLVFYFVNTRNAISNKKSNRIAIVPPQANINIISSQTIQ
jgi:hypothetical protein